MSGELRSVKTEDTSSRDGAASGRAERIKAYFVAGDMKKGIWETQYMILWVIAS